MRAVRLDNGNLLVPMRAESDDGMVEGDGVVEIGPDSPEYAAWLAWLDRNSSFNASADATFSEPTPVVLGGDAQPYRVDGPSDVP